MVRKNTSRRWDLWSEVGPPIGGDISNQRWHLQSEVGPPIRGDTSDWRWHLQLELGPPIRGGLCMWGHTGAPMLHVRISYSFEKKKRLFIVDYIKPSPVYQVKCKLVQFAFTALLKLLLLFWDVMFQKLGNVQSLTASEWSLFWEQVFDPPTISSHRIKHQSLLCCHQAASCSLVFR